VLVERAAGERERISVTVRRLSGAGEGLALERAGEVR